MRDDKPHEECGVFGVIGVNDADSLMLAISDRIKNNILPTSLGLYDVYGEEYDGKTIIHVVVHAAPKSPITLSVTVNRQRVALSA